MHPTEAVTAGDDDGSRCSRLLSLGFAAQPAARMLHALLDICCVRQSVSRAAWSDSGGGAMHPPDTRGGEAHSQPGVLMIVRTWVFRPPYTPAAYGNCFPSQVIKYPLTTESAMKKIEDNNTLVFIVDAR